MKRYLSFLALLSIMSILFACGGGSSSTSTPGSTDSTAPAVTAFTMPATATSLTVTGITLTATDNTAVTGYMITTTASAPAAGADGWSATAPTSVTFGAAGAQTVYAWARDAAGNVSASRSATVTITVATTAAREVNGVVTNPVSGTPLGGATVSAFVQLGSLVAKSVAATAIATATTDANGSYTIPGLTSGVTYYFEISATGFATFTYYNISPDASNILTLENARILPSNIASQTATASGTVKNASTNAGLPGMTVKIRSGVNNTTGTVRATATTDATGAYSFATLAAGTYTAEVTGNIGSIPIVTSYFTLVSFPGTTLNTNQDFPVTSGTVAGSYRIVLNWGNDPRDLDSHLTGPAAATGANATTGTRFHVYFSNPANPSGSTTSDSAGNRIAGPTTEAFPMLTTPVTALITGPKLPQSLCRAPGHTTFLSIIGPERATSPLPGLRSRFTRGAPCWPPITHRLVGPHRATCGLFSV